MLRVVVVSNQPLPVLEILRTKLPGCLPLAVPSLQDVAEELDPDSVVLLDLGDGAAGTIAARQLRAGGVSNGIVVIGTDTTDGLSGVYGLTPPLRFGDLADALHQAHLRQQRVRVVVVSRQPLVVLDVLRTKLQGCLPVAVPTVEEVIGQLRPGSVVLLDLGEGEAGARATERLRSQGVHHGIVVIGGGSIDQQAGVAVLHPPFRLGELAGAFQQVRSMDPAGSGGDPGPGSKAEEAATPLPAVDPAQRVFAPPPPPGSGSTQPTDVQPRSPTSPAAAGRSGSDTSASGTTPRAGPVRREQVELVPELAQGAAAAVDLDLLHGRLPQRPGATPQHARPREQSLRGKLERWRQRGGGDAVGTEEGPSQHELYERLAAIFAATLQLETIADELPMVGDRPALYRAIVTAIAEEFEADTVGLLRRRGNGWTVEAERGFTLREARFPVGLDQPLLAEIDASAGAILLDPVVSFQSLVSGIGGAHTESFMAACVATGPNRLGILTVGRDQALVEADLDRLVEMAAEAAVGLGVADHIQQMAALADRMSGRPQREGISIGQVRESFREEVSEAWHTSAPRGPSRERTSEANNSSPVTATGSDDATVRPAPREEGSRPPPAPDLLVDLTDPIRKRG